MEIIDKKRTAELEKMIKKKAEEEKSKKNEDGKIPHAVVYEDSTPRLS